jgi:hypothetical protein
VEGGPTAFSVAHSLPALPMVDDVDGRQVMAKKTILPSKDPTGCNWLVLAGLSLISI